METTVSSLEHLTQCPVCMEKFTFPKMLNCQHSFCQSCLLSLVELTNSLTCPLCRQVHQLPEGGVKDLDDNLIIKNLLELNFNTIQQMDNCSDCRKTAAVTNCEHCTEKICVDCRVNHNKVSWEIDSIMESLIALKASQQSKIEEWLDSYGKLYEEVGNMSELFRKLEEKWLDRKSEVLKSLELFARVHDVLTDQSSKPIIEDICHKMKSANTMKKLANLRDHYCHVLNGAKFMISGGTIELDGSILEELEKAIDSFGGVRCGEEMVKFDDLMCKKEGTTSPIPCQIEENMIESSTASGTNFVDTNSVPSESIQCPLPSNVNYKTKSSPARVTVLGSSKNQSKLVSPSAVTYNPADGKVYVADFESDRVMQYDLENRKSRPVFLSLEPTSLAISNGHLYVTEKERKIRVFNLQTETVFWFPEKGFQADYVCSYGNRLLFLDTELSGGNTIHVYDTLHGRLDRSFRVAARLVLGVTVSPTEQVYLSTQEKGKCAIQVYSIDGFFQREFDVSSEQLGDISRVCVDGDEFLSVTRPVSDRVDVYSSQGKFVCSIGKSGKGAGELNAPSGLGWMMNGRLMICDSDNNRVQIF